MPKYGRSAWIHERMGSQSALLVQVMHAIAKRTDAGQDEGVDLVQLVRFLDDARGKIQRFHRFVDAAQISRSVVDDSRGHGAEFPLFPSAKCSKYSMMAACARTLSSPRGWWRTLLVNPLSKTRALAVSFHCSCRYSVQLDLQRGIVDGDQRLAAAVEVARQKIG